MLIGLLVSGILLAASYFIGDATIAIVDGAAGIIDAKAQSEQFISALFILKIILSLLLVCLWIIAFALFDRAEGSITKEYLAHSIQDIRKVALKEISSKTKGLIHHSQKNQKIESTNNKQEKISTSKIFSELIEAGRDFVLIFQKKPKNISLLWSMGIMGIFSYWDTFLATFLPIFFTEVLREQSGWVQNIPGSILMLVFILPILGLLPIVAKLGDRFGRHYFMLFGIFLTAISTGIAGIVSMQSFWILVGAGFGISFGYLFGMSSAKAQTASKLNTFITAEKKQKQADPNASAGPIMLVDNMGNIVGPLIGGLMISLLDFQGFFLIFAVFLFLLSGYSLKNFSAISEKKKKS
jgi:Na+/melibiose symporter-like transporter